MSLKSISLRNFVIVRELDLELEPGFTVLTGETGAGKSILIDALQLALGSRADSGVIRDGATRCEISVELDSPADLRTWLDEAGFDPAETLVLKRTIDMQGKSRAWINGSTALATQLKVVADRLVDIHGQHAWQSLTRPDSVRQLLDRYASIGTEQLSRCWRQWRVAQKELEQARQSQDSLQQERERLVWQIGEVDKLAPGLDEWEELNARHARLSHAQALREAVQSAAAALNDAEDNAATLLGRAMLMLQNQLSIEPQFAELTQTLQEALAQVEDVTHSLHAYARHAVSEPQDLEKLDERLSLWINLSRRYKRSAADLPELLVSWQKRLRDLDQASDLLALEKAESSSLADYLKEAKRVSKARRDAAPLLAKAITQAMQGLGMVGGKFDVALLTLDQPAEHGLEQAEFLVAGHSGTKPRSVGKVASGGELSRIALAIAVTTSQLGQADTLIFDEVDAGIGGAVAESVGRLMRQLGQDRQVLAVTHLPQVAACADHHLVVSKLTEQGQTISQVSAAEKEQRVTEVARMLGGERLSETSRAHAKEMLGR